MQEIERYSTLPNSANEEFTLFPKFRYEEVPSPGRWGRVKRFLTNGKCGNMTIRHATIQMARMEGDDIVIYGQPDKL